MAMTREDILNLNINDSLIEEYLVEAMQNKHSSTTFKKQLEAALTANDELHEEVNHLRARLERLTANGPDTIKGEAVEEG